MNLFANVVIENTELEWCENLSGVSYDDVYTWQLLNSNDQVISEVNIVTFQPNNKQRVTYYMSWVTFLMLFVGDQLNVLQCTDRQTLHKNLEIEITWSADVKQTPAGSIHEMYQRTRQLLIIKPCWGHFQEMWGYYCDNWEQISRKFQICSLTCEICWFVKYIMLQFISSIS